MKTQKGFLIAVICLVLGLFAPISLAQQGQDEFSAEDLSAAANLVVTAVSGPAQAYLNQTISVTFTVKNQGDAASGAYQVGLYLSKDRPSTATTKTRPSTLPPTGRWERWHMPLGWHQGIARRGPRRY